jgi:hypothetical protein
MTQYSTLSTIVSPTPYASMASSFTISEILHEISKADIPAQPTSTLDLMVKTASSGTASGGLSTGATLGIISGIVFVVIILAFIVVKCLRHCPRGIMVLSWVGVGKGNVVVGEGVYWLTHEELMLCI